MNTEFHPKNIVKPNTPKNLSNIGTGILMFTSGMIPIVMTLPINQTIISWIVGLLNAAGLGTKIITMMFGVKIQSDENKEEIEKANEQV